MRGNGKQAQIAKQQGKLSAFVKPKGSEAELQPQGYYVSWKDVNPDLIVGAVWAANKEGGALLLGHSRDKTCYSVKVYSGGDGTPYYFPYTDNGIVELEAFLQSLCDIGEENA